MKNKLEIKIAWLYPDLMSTYGDRGNIIILKERLIRREIGANVIEISMGTSSNKLKEANILFIGGAQDREQEIVNNDLICRRKILKGLIESGVPGLFICGAYQFLGNYYLDAKGTKIPGLGIFNLYTINPGLDSKRLIGNVAARIKIPTLSSEMITGFENHGGRTFLSDSIKPFAKIIFGGGNNGEDRTEGAIYKNAIGTYFHGPILASNPHLADFLIMKALEKKYGKKITLAKLDDKLEELARASQFNKIFS